MNRAFADKYYIAMLMVLLSIPQFSFAKEHKFLSGIIKHIPDHLGAAIGGLVGGALGEPIPAPSTGPAGAAIGGLIGSAFDDAVKDEEQQKEKVHNMMDDCSCGCAYVLGSPPCPIPKQ